VKDKEKKFTVKMRVRGKLGRPRRRRQPLARVLVMERGQAKAPYAAIELHIGGGKVAVYTLAAMHKAVR